MNHSQALCIAYIGGGSRGWAWQLMGDLALEESLLGEVRLYDIDLEAAKRNAVIGNRISQLPTARSKWLYTAVEEMDQALEGADFVIISILPGTFDEMASDVHAPEAYGVYQSVGDTAGPGGIIRALRAGPMFEEIARAIARCCPTAWVINYTNPMAQCVHTLYDTFKDINAVGCCHEVFGTQKLLCRMLAQEAGIENLDRRELDICVQGVNHFTFITDARYKGEDIIPAYRDFAQKYAKTGYEDSDKGNWMNNLFASGNRVKFDLFLQYGAIAAAGDRHLAEFMPGTKYLKDPNTAAQWQFALTPVSWRKADLKKRLERSQRLFNGEEIVQLSPSGEEGVDIIKALLGLGNLVTNLNLNNIGQISNLPLGAVVETNALIMGGCIVPLYTGEIPDALVTLTTPAVNAQKAIAKAIRQKAAAPAFQAFLNDPLLCTLSSQQARELYRMMLDNTSAYLKEWDLSF